MVICRYEIFLLDFLFYTQEAIAGTVTPGWLHATAINYALALPLLVAAREQAYFSRLKRGRNVPAYESSLVPQAEYYATGGKPAGLAGLKNVTFLVKGDGEGYVGVTRRKNSRASKVKGGEVLRVSRVTMLPPETRLQGYVFMKDHVDFPQRIRLGRFRSPALFSVTPADEWSFDEGGIVDHPVDPLVTKVERGVMVPILPYPLVDRAYVKKTLSVRFGGQRVRVALPDDWEV